MFYFSFHKFSISNVLKYADWLIKDLGIEGNMLFLPFWTGLSQERSLWSETETEFSYVEKICWHLKECLCAEVVIIVRWPTYWSAAHS